MTELAPAPPVAVPGAGADRLAAAGPLGGRRRALALAVIVAGTFMTLLDSTIVNVALVPIGRDLGTTVGVEWIAGAYVMALAVAQPVAGWLGDRFGRKTVFLACIASFALTSAAVATCSRLDLLIACRVLQGLAGGGVLPLSMAMILELFRGREYARATAVWAMAATVAPTLGPAFGGWLATSFGWHSLFLVNAPIGLATVVVGVYFLPAVRAPRPARFDAGGFVLGSGGLACLMLALGQGAEWGWSSVGTLLSLGAGAAMAGGFVVRELSTRHPLIEIRMFADRGFRLAMSIGLLAGMVHSSRLVFLPLELENVRGYTPLRVGLLFIPAGIANTAALMARGTPPTASRPPAHHDHRHVDHARGPLRVLHTHSDDARLADHHTPRRPRPRLRPHVRGGDGHGTR